jgi:RsiW-degrading membrane proteinase PrsW (M82 family)
MNRSTPIPPEIYEKWLGIPVTQCPPNFYVLLGLALYESDLALIKRAGDERIKRIRPKCFKHREVGTQLLNEITQARICLSQAETKAAYDRALRSHTLGTFEASAVGLSVRKQAWEAEEYRLLPLESGTEASDKTCAKPLSRRTIPASPIPDAGLPAVAANRHRPDDEADGSQDWWTKPAWEAALKRWRASLINMDWRGLIPLRGWHSDRPWEQPWVQGAAFLFGFPLFAIVFPGFARAFPIYFAIVWAFLFQLHFRPRSITARGILLIWLAASAAVLVALVILPAIGRLLPIVRIVFTAAESSFFLGRLAGTVLAVGLVAEAAKVVPVVWFMRRSGEELRPLAVLYLGILSGLAFGGMEGLIYPAGYPTNWRETASSFESHAYFFFPLLQGIWTGILARFICISRSYGDSQWVVLGVGLIGVSVLHGSYRAFAHGWCSLLIAVLSLALFIDYLRSCDAAGTSKFAQHDDDDR